MMTPAEQLARFEAEAERVRRLVPSPSALMFTSGPSAGEEIGDYRGDPLYHASLGEQEYRELLSQYGFDVVTYMVEDPSSGRHTIWLAQLSSTLWAG